MACQPLDSKRKRTIVVRPPGGNKQDIIAPIHEEPNDHGDDGEMAGSEDKWDELADKYEDLERKV